MASKKKKEIIINKHKWIFLFIGKHVDGNLSPPITWEIYNSIWWSAGLVFALLLVLSLVMFMLYRHLKPHGMSNIPEVLEDQEIDREQFVSGSLLLLYSQQSDEKVVQKVGKMKEHPCYKYMAIFHQ